MILYREIRNYIYMILERNYSIVQIVHQQKMPTENNEIQKYYRATSYISSGGK